MISMTYVYIDYYSTFMFIHIAIMNTQFTSIIFIPIERDEVLSCTTAVPPPPPPPLLCCGGGPLSDLPLCQSWEGSCSEQPQLSALL